MEFTVSKADLVRELSLSQGVVEKKTTIPILSNVLMEAAGDRVVLTATDLELGIRCSCPARVKKEGSGTVPARKLLDYVRLLPEGDVQMKFLENHWASITCGRSQDAHRGHVARELSRSCRRCREPIAEIPVKMLASMISRTVVCDLDGGIALHAERRAAADAAGGTDDGRDRWPSSGVRGERSPRRAATWTSSFRALIPKKAMAEIVKLADEAGREDTRGIFAGDDNHLFFQVGHRLLMTRKLTGNFPDYERVLPKDHIHIGQAAERRNQIGHRARGAVRR